MSEEEYSSLFDFLNSSKITPGNTDLLAERIKRLPKPPECVFCIISPSEITPFESFMSKFFANQIPPKLHLPILKLVSFAPKGLLDTIVSSLIPSISPQYLPTILSALPDCRTVFVSTINNLTDPNLFIVSFVRLFNSIDSLQSDMRILLKSKLSEALNKGICFPYFNEMLSIASSTQAALDVLFQSFIADTSHSAFYSDAQFLAPLCSAPSVPLSVLQFVSLYNPQMIIPSKQIFSLLSLFPTQTTEYLIHLGEKASALAWKGILEILVALDRSVALETQTNFLFIFLAFACKRPSLINELLDVHLHVWFPTILSSMKESSRQNLSLLCVFLIFCWISEPVASTFCSSFNVQSFFDSIIDHQSDFSLITTSIIWVLKPSQTLPFSTFEITVPNAFKNLPQPSNQFSLSIIPLFLGSVMRIGAERIVMNSKEIEASRLPIGFISLNDSNSEFQSNDSQSFGTPLSSINSNFKSSDDILPQRRASDLSFEGFRRESFDYDEVDDYSFIQNYVDDTIQLEEPMRNFLTFLLSMFVSSKQRHCLLLGSSFESSLNALIPYILKSNLCFLVVSFAMSLDCHFSSFYMVYSLLHEDLSHFITFLSILSAETPVVSEFISVNSAFHLTSPPFSSSVLIWARGPAIISVQTSSEALTVSVDYQRVVLKSSTKELHSVPLENLIDGWSFLAISFTQNSIEVSANLKRFSYSVDLRTPPIIQIGGKKKVFDLQSIRVFHPKCSSSQLRTYFSYGPSYTERIRPSLIKHIPYISDTYVSSFYIPWAYLFQIKPESETDGQLTLSYEPPFPQINQKYLLKPFICSLNSVGGVSLLVHLSAEVILRNPNMQSSLFHLLRLLYSRFPEIHGLFVETSAYQTIGSLLWSPTLNSEALSSAMTSNIRGDCLLTNAAVVKHWLLGPSLHKCEFSSIISSIVSSLKERGAFSSFNRKILEGSDAFSFIVRAISGTHTAQFLDLLSDLAFVVTSRDSASDNVAFAFKILVADHLKYSGETKPNDEGCRVLLNLVLRISSFFKVLIPLENLIPALPYLSARERVISLNLLFSNLNASYRYALALAISSLKIESEISEFFYSSAIASINSQSHNFFEICISLLYFLSDDSLHATCDAIFVASLPKIARYDEFDGLLYDLVLKIIHKSDETIQHFNSSANLEVVGSPMHTFVSAFIFRSVELQKIEYVEDFFTALSSNIDLTLLIMSEVMDFVWNRGSSSDKFVLCCLSVAGHIFSQISLEPGSQKTFVSLFLCKAIRCSNSSSVPKLIEALSEAATFCPIGEEIIEGVKSSAIMGSKLATQLIDRLRNPIGYSPTKPKKPSQKMALIEERLHHQDSKDSEGLLTLFCNSIQFQNEAAADIAPFEDEDTYLESWKIVLSEIDNPSSLIFEGPRKYRLLDSTTKPELRRLLFPINPSLDPTFKTYWEVKYGDQIPIQRVTFEEVRELAPLRDLRERSTLFSGDAMRLCGTSLEKGLIVVGKGKLKFYLRTTNGYLYDQLFLFSSISCVRMTSFQHQNSGITVETKEQERYFFAFESPSIRDGFSEVLSKNGIKVAEVFDRSELLSMQKDWMNGTISNFEYILGLNFMSERMWSDVTRYPIFPWVLIDYSKFNLSEEKCFRNFSYPIYAQTLEQRKEAEEYYNQTSEVTSEPHHTPSYVSNVGSPLYYLVRIEPFTTLLIDFQGGRFDTAERSFRSFQGSLNVMLNPECRSAHELVPELFFVPEVLNNVNFVKFPDGTEKIDIVNLPIWADTPQAFIRKMRKALESDYVSTHLNEWIDLIWGVRRRGPLAIERYNVNQETVFEFDYGSVQTDRLLKKAVKEQIHSCGQAPEKLFSEFHAKRSAQTKFKTDIIIVGTQKSSSAEWYWLDGGYRVKIEGFTVCIRSSDNILFDESVRPLFIQCSGSEFSIAHFTPIISVWEMKNAKADMETKLRVHPSPITALLFDTFCSIVGCGHSDGAITLYSAHPFLFVRVLFCTRRSPIYLLAVSPADSHIVCLQKAESGSEITLWTANGEVMCSRHISEEAISCVVTSFAIGTRKNLIILLTRCGTVICLSPNHLKEKRRIELPQSSYVRLSLRRNRELYAYTSSRSKVKLSFSS